MCKINNKLILISVNSKNNKQTRNTYKPKVTLVKFIYVLTSSNAGKSNLDTLFSCPMSLLWHL